VVQEAEQRLERKECEEHNSNDWMRVIQSVEVLGHPDTDTESCGVQDESEYLEQAVYPPEAWE
jgi:hypothetical protein